MEQDKKPEYLHLITVLPNVVIFFSIILGLVTGNLDFGGALILLPLSLGVSSFATVFPVSISSLPDNHRGYGIPAFLLLPVAFSIYEYYTCVGKFCDAIWGWIGFLSGLVAISFALFYTIGVYARKKNARFTKYIFIAECLFFLGIFLFFVFIN